MKNTIPFNCDIPPLEKLLAVFVRNYIAIARGLEEVVLFVCGDMI